MGHVSVGSQPAGFRFDSASAQHLITAGNPKAFPTALISKTVSWSLSPVSHADLLLKQRDTASMARLLHVYRQVSWPELLKQVWSKNRLSLSSLF